MLKKKRFIFVLLLLVCLCLSISIASANNTTDIDDLNNTNHDEYVVDNHSNKSFTDLNNLINDLNKSEIILEDDYVYQDELDSNFSEGIVINRNVTIDGKGHVLYFDRPAYVFNVNADNITLKNIVIYNPHRPTSIMGVVCNGLCTTYNLTVLPENIDLSLSIIANDIYDIYNQSSVINIEFETSIANAYFWVEIPGLLEKTNLTSNNERKAMLSISNITKYGCYKILCDFIKEKYTESYYIPSFSILYDPSIMEFVYINRKNIKIIYRENLKNNNSFNDLQLLIDNASTNEINLEKDYEFFSGDKPINVNKSIIINGNNHIIDAKNVSKIFNILADNVIIKNIVFTGASNNLLYNKYTFFEPMTFVGFLPSYNAVSYGSSGFQDTTYYKYYDYDSGAIYCKGNNLRVINSSFINNYGTTGGGVYIRGNNSQLINLSFINNSAQSGAAIYNVGKNTFISNSIFDSNDGRFSDSIYSEGDINIQNCNFVNESESVVFYKGSWQIDNVTSSYYDSFMKLGYVDFTFNLTHLKYDEYNLKMIFDFNLLWFSSLDNKIFYLNIDGNCYTLKTDANSQADINLKLSNGLHYIEIYNPITKSNITKSFNVSDSTVRLSLIIVAKNKVFNKKLKTKLYHIILKNNKGKVLKNTWVTLKIKGKLFKAKTNGKGRATFKITKFYKKGNFKSVIKFKGSKNYKSVSKKINIKIK